MKQLFRWKKNKGNEDEAIKQKEVFKQIGYEISVAASQVSSVSESLFMNIEENTTSSELLFAKAQEMTAQSTQTSSTLTETLENVEEVVGVIHQVEEATKHLKKMNVEATNTIEHNLQTILSVVQVIEEIESASQATKDYMVALNHASEEILHILDTVNQISRQTHLLALNASIESARAGEAGKGFAVVAEEIRSLSNNTSVAVQDVSALMDTMKKSLGNVNTYVDLNADKVEEGVCLSRGIEQSLGQMQHSFGNVTNCVEEIEKFSQQEVGLARHMNEQMKKVNQLSNLAAINVEDVCIAIGTQKSRMEELGGLGKVLRDSASDLNTLIEVHKLNDLSELKQIEMESYVSLLNEIVKMCCKEKEFTMLNKNYHERLLKELKAKHERIEAIWTNTQKGRFITSIPAAGISNGNIRAWFKEAMQGKTYVSEPYISAITKNPCVTLSTPIIDEMRKIIGVMGIDVKIG